MLVTSRCGPDPHLVFDEGRLKTGELRAGHRLVDFMGARQVCASLAAPTPEP